MAQQDACDLSTPPPGALVVEVGMVVLDVFQLSDANQEFTTDFIGLTRWQDPRLADCPEPSLESLWEPMLAVTNRRVRAVIGEPRIRVEGTQVLRSQRFTGPLTVPLDLREFPFDQQLLAIEAVLVSADSDVELRPAPELSSLQPGAILAGWTLSDDSIRASSREILDGMPLHSVRFEVTATRIKGHFIWKVILPMVVILLMSWGVFWIPMGSFPTQVSVATTSVLTLFAYQFALSAVLPRVDYLTRMDQFSLGAVILVLFSFVSVLVAGRLNSQDQEQRAQQFVKVGRWVHPVVLASLLVFAFVL